MEKFSVEIDDTSSKKEWDVVVLGGINTDFLIQVPHLPKPGETILGSNFLESQGGKGANQAVAAARLGAKVALIGKIGKDSRSENVLANLEREGITTSFVLKDSVANTGIALISVDKKGEKQIIVAPEANSKLFPSDILLASFALIRSRVFLSQLEVPLQSVISAIEFASQVGIQVVLDAGPAQSLPEHIYHLLDVIRLNSAEAEIFTGIPVFNRSSAQAAAIWFINKGVKAAIVQAGAEGNILISNNEEIWLPNFHVKSIDCTGAGDALVAALAVSIAEKKSLREAALFGSAAAALATTVLGAQVGLPNRSEILDLINQQGSGST